MVDLAREGRVLELRHNGRTVLRHAPHDPAVRLGHSRVLFFHFKGRFRILDLSILRPLRMEAAASDGEGATLVFMRGRRRLIIRAREHEGLLRLELESCDPGAAIALALHATPEERIYGCGERFTRLDLRGERVRNWVEEHIGFFEAVRKVLLLKFGIRPRVRAFSHYSTYFPLPTFISSAGYFCHVDAEGYGTFDFRRRNRHVIRFHGVPHALVMGGAERRDGEPVYPSLLRKLSAFVGRPSPLPSWVYGGMVLGIQGGTARCEEKLRRLCTAGACVCGIWAQDWEGQRKTYFGTQLRWDWRWDAALYPDLAKCITRWEEEGVAFLGYVNPYLCEDGVLYAEAFERGFLARHPRGGPYLTAATSFPFGIVDLTNPAAYDWLKSIMKKNMLELGLKGWMADFGEYLPADAILARGTGREWHNRWPVLWARLNEEAVAEAGCAGDALFFVRSGYTGVAAHAGLVWNGDQHVDWSEDYGLGSVVRASLSLAMSGVPLCHGDVGGYTTLPGVTRSKELFLRWLELACFSPVFRTHEGNRPEANWQFDSDEETIAAVARFSRLHAALAPYLRDVVDEAVREGLPAMRPLFFHYDEDFGFDADHAFLLGRDIAVYPVLAPNARTRRLRLPRDAWIGLFDGRAYPEGGTCELAAPLGRPPVFFRAQSSHRSLFARLSAEFGDTN